MRVTVRILCDAIDEYADHLTSQQYVQLHDAVKTAYDNQAYWNQLVHMEPKSRDLRVQRRQGLRICDEYLELNYVRLKALRCISILRNQERILNAAV